MDGELSPQLHFPLSMFSKTTGIGVDFGSSQIKVAYTATLPLSDRLKIHFTSFPIEHYAEAIQFVHSMYGGKPNSGRRVQVTGIKFDQQKIQDKLNAKCDVAMETDRLLAGLHFLLKNCPLKDLIYPLPAHVKQASATYKEQFGANLQMFSEASGGMVSVPPVYSRQGDLEQCCGHSEDGALQIQYPAMLFILGSALQMYMLNEEGSCTLHTVSPICGRALLGLGSLLLNIKSFKELVELASKGCANNIDMDLNKSNEDQSYPLVGDYTILSLGQAAGLSQGDFSREDLAAVCVSLVAESVGTMCELMAATHRVKQVLFCGGLISGSQLVREQIWKIYLSRITCNQSVTVLPDTYFLKHGMYLSSIGCLLTDLSRDDQ